MAIKRVRIRIDQYADCRKVWSWVSGGTAVDFTGCTAKFELRVTPSDASPLLTVTTTATSSGSIALGTLGGGNPGIVNLNILKAATALLTPCTAHGDLLITYADGISTDCFLAIDALIFPGNTY